MSGTNSLKFGMVRALTKTLENKLLLEDINSGNDIPVCSKANAFNDFFSTVAGNIQSSISPLTKTEGDMLNCALTNNDVALNCPSINSFTIPCNDYGDDSVSGVFSDPRFNFQEISIDEPTLVKLKSTKVAA